MATRMIQRRGTAAEWSSANPVLAAGEIGFETDTQKFKFGDGTTAWADTTYFASADQLIDGAPELLDTLNEIAAAIGDDEDFFNTINDKIDAKANLTIADSVPTNGPDGTEALQEGDLWYDRANGHIYVYYHVDPVNDIYVWVETGGSDSYESASLGTNNHDFPTSPSNGDAHKGFIYDSSRGAWQIDRSFNLDEASDVVITSASENDVVMYSATAGEWINRPGVPLDENLDIPLSYLTELSDDVDVRIAGFGTTTVQTESEWAADSSVPTLGSLNVSTGASIRAKIGDGTNTFGNLEYIPNNSYVSAQITTALSTYATKADPTFSGTVSLPSTTSIGNVSDAEIGHLDGVTSGIQGQLDSLDTLKAPIADPTFTGTVSGVSKTMVGLSSVDNTSDVNKPVSTAQQAALDTKLDLAGGTLTGNLILNADPTQALGAVTKQYADSISEGLHIHASVVALSDSNIDLTGATPTTVIDGVTLADGDRVIVNGQTDSAENGIYVFATTGSVFSRAEDFDEPAEVAGGDFVFVLGGTSYENTGWVKTSDTVATIGTDAINFTQFSGAGSVTGGTNIEVTGTQVAVADAPVFAGTVDASAAGVAFSDGTQTQAGVPSLTEFAEKTASYQLDTLDHKDNVVEMNMSTAGTFTVPLDATLSWPVGASMDIFATGTGEITIDAEDPAVTLNATPGLTLRTQWSSATIMKRGANNWVVFGDLKA